MRARWSRHCRRCYKNGRQIELLVVYVVWCGMIPLSVIRDVFCIGMIMIHRPSSVRYQYLRYNRLWYCFYESAKKWTFWRGWFRIILCPFFINTRRLKIQFEVIHVWTFTHNSINFLAAPYRPPPPTEVIISSKLVTLRQSSLSLTTFLLFAVCCLLSSFCFLL